MMMTASQLDAGDCTPKSIDRAAYLQVSAGYDCHWRDPLATLQMRSSTFHRLSTKIKALANELAGLRKPRHFTFYFNCWHFTQSHHSTHLGTSIGIRIAQQMLGINRVADFDDMPEFWQGADVSSSSRAATT